MNIKKYIVLKCDGVSGLLVTDHVFAPGTVFNSQQWKWGDDALKAAIKNGRCEEVEEKKKESKKKDSKDKDK